MVSTILSSGVVLIPSGARAQSIGCDVEVGVCNFYGGGNPSSTPYLFTSTGSAGSGSTNGSAGTGAQFIYGSNLDVSLPGGGNTDSYLYATWVNSIGGNGSEGGPSAGGAGGAISAFPPSSMQFNILQYYDTAYEIEVGRFTSTGGDGNDNNTNDASDGGAGGAGGSVSYFGFGQNVTLTTTLTGQAANGPVAGIRAASSGGHGGRGNESVSYTPKGGDGGAGGEVFVNTGTITVGSSSNPIVGTDVYGVWALSTGGRGPNNYNSSNQKTEGGGGASTGGAGGHTNVVTSGNVTVHGQASSGRLRGIYSGSIGGDGGWSYDVGVDSDFTAGGDGGDGGEADATISNNVNVIQSGTSASSIQSAAVAVISEGGDGGVGQSGTSGGTGGDGAKVSVTINESGDISAQGTAVDGLYAVSRGGVGGDGLKNANNSPGGTGGNAGEVVIHSSGDNNAITAAASSAGSDSGRGIVAQSVGNFGGGGSDGNAVFGNPGSAGTGGNGGTVDITLEATTTISTDGTNSVDSGLAFAHGILAQSIGGGGGDGGDFQGLFGGESGAGGKGGTGSNVSVSTQLGGSITTHGINANGILAQSIGGGGGSGGVSDAVGVALGGSGGDGGATGTVDVEIQSGMAIETYGYGAAGILAQAITGSGGAAGVTTAIVSLGATGGNAAASPPGKVTVDNAGSVTTHGDAAIGVHAQSIGGGGGGASGKPSTDSSSTDYGVFTLGTTGGEGGSGGEVEVGNVGNVTTSGLYAHGVHAQSIGGGGGNGGDAFSVGILNVPTVAIGGQGSSAGNGGTVTISDPDPINVQTSGLGAAGVFAQSVGGGGGSGGDATADTFVDDLQFTLGGYSGGGGAAGDASVTLKNGSITTGARQAAAVKVQSIGGGGGSGGNASSTSAGFISLGFALGGKGGDGGAGAEASATMTNMTIGTATTDSDPYDAIGMLIQSIGGGGGTGGTATASSLTTGFPIDPEDPDYTLSFSAQFALGGSGGSGGDGSTATGTLENGSALTTNGAGSHGMLVQSIGGGGGSGGDARTATTTFPDSTEQYTLTIDAALGGTGGNGGTGGAASAVVGTSGGSSTPTTITTNGQYANGVMVQSIGGGGGNSGVPTSTTNNIAGAGNFGITLDLGAANLDADEGGADGGTASVTLYEDAQITTTGDGSRGVLVQSVGGGGGTVQGGELSMNAEFKSQGEGDAAVADASDDDDDSNCSSLTGANTYCGSLTVSLGGSGGSGGAGKAVTVTMEGAEINTSGIDADGILAQSIGGGGGLAGTVGSSDNIADDGGDGDGDGDDVAAADEDDDDDDGVDVSLALSVGGSGGTGGGAGAVTVSHRGHTTTQGDWADGVVAQSIGGGGGTGGTALSSSTGATGQIDVGVGGKGGSGGTAGTVTMSFNDDNPGSAVTTNGYMAHAIVGQSIGGGGGQGADGSDTATGSLSVGGAAGGSGGTASAGNTVEVNGYSVVTTHGADSHAIVAQSIGGGGGIGGAGTSDTSEGGDDSYSVDIAVGGRGGLGGDGGQVTVDIGTEMRTYGNRAFGIVAQSIGGGGGIGGVGSADNIASLNLGATGGSGGSGEAVSVDVTSGFIDTTGRGSHGIIAQSIGGGGGIAGDAGSGPMTYVNRAGGANGNGGSVSVTTNASISTTGDYAFGIIGQSIGGGGGLGGDSSGVNLAGNMWDGAYTTASTVDITNNASVHASGEGSIGIFGQSDAPDQTAKVTVTANADVTGGSGENGYGVFVSNGNANQLTVAEGVTVTAGSGGYAVGYFGVDGATEGSTLTVDNYGTISGNMQGNNDDGSNAITVNNYSSNSLIGATLYEAHVNNYGRLVVGSGTDAGETLTITGDFRQSRAGTLATVADFAAGETAALAVGGDVRLGGRIEVDATTLQRGASPTLVTAGGTMTGTITAIDTPAVDFETVVENGEVRLTVAGTRFNAAFDLLEKNQSTAGGHLDALFDAGATRYAAILADYNRLAGGDADGRDYALALSALSPGASQAAAASHAVLTQGRLDKALSCPAFKRGDAMLTEDSCAWTEAGGAAMDQGGAPGYDGSLWGFAGGAQVEFKPEWYVGFAGGYESSRYKSSDGFSRSTGDTVYAAVALKRQIGGFLLSGAITGSYGWYDVDRGVVAPGFSGTARGDYDIVSLGARARVAYTVANDFGYVRPFLDVDAIYAHSGGYTESGAGLYNLKVSSQDQFAFVATPAMEVGARLKMAMEWDARLYATAGVSLSTEDDWVTEARLNAAPSGTGTFETTLPVADVLARIGAGIAVSHKSGFDLNAAYEGAFGDDYQSHSGTIRLEKRF
ncbi:autotransporter outer membrane beta-barrel domain-containing protein [Acuticoccus yangtzensis]|nr:autotransporter outer membrane beta-barrel domain-containing protein [Acuticoccus yangtzensis]